jgi:hypothetical protein
LETRVGIRPETPLFRARIAHLATEPNQSLSPLGPAKLIKFGVRFGVRPPSKGKENLIPESDSYKIRPALTKEQGKINQRI